MKRPDEFPCATCALRRRAEARPRSFVAVLWRLHTRFCPGWRAYQRAVEQARDAGGE